MAIQGDHEAILVRSRANTVYIDPVTVEIAGSYTGAELDAYTRISEAADPLHFGYFGGFVTQLLWFVFGVLLSSLSITGVLIYAKRIGAARYSVAESSGSPAPATASQLQGADPL